jgi:signal-transduction protein with cAMP-binding, CBS, and nucleotidyltransferase domain
VNEHQYFYEVLKLASDQQLSIIAVVDDAGQYMGSITQNDLISYFAKSMSVDLPGGVIILEVSENDYSLTEIANIVESNDAKILSSYIISKTNSIKLEVVIKVSKINLDSIIKTFERYNYKIVASYQESTNYDELRDNYDSLINYLNI